ncbi:MAG TPA: PQQ-binding-like beta-propeller repeat protein [Steroidobacteraceae bacterium]|jgi:quinoprotein glucose dehydrogenase|nr:PQQ-binding-like beta-propeller repeat protein [Steroidobacteraceae bacterium]
MTGTRVLLLLALTAQAAPAPNSPSTHRPVVAPRALAQGTDVEWRSYGGDPGGRKYSALADIDRRNVSKLALAWSWATGETPLAEYKTSPGMFEATPLVVDGVLYVSTPYNRVAALDARTGRELWSYDPKAYVAGQVPNGTGFVHRGVAAWRDSRTRSLRILMNSRDRLIELDARTGTPVDGFGVHGFVDLLAGLQWPIDPKRYTNTSPPLLYGDLVIVGNGVADRLIYRRDPPGDVRAFDARTGKQVWSFHTVPRDGELGSSTWGRSSNHYTGHTNVWAPMTLDAERGLVYLPVSTPSNDFYGGNRPGANLFGDTLVCLDAKTGLRRWHRQLVHHGLWDYDPPGPPSLISIEHRGKRVDAVVELTKQGFAFVFDRVSGEPLWPIEERAVPKSDVPGEESWPTQPAPVGLPPLLPQGTTLDDATDLTPQLHAAALAVLKRVRLGPVFTPPSLQGTLVRPGLDGGADWGGGAFDPQSGILYVKVNDDPALIFPDLTDAEGNVPAVSPNDSTDISLYLERRIPVLKPPYAYLDALDLNNGRMLWQQAYGDDPDVRRHPALAGATLPPHLGAIGNGGLLVTAGGLLFAGSGDYAVHAIDKDTGQDLWTYPTGDLKTNGSPMTYRVGGRQYVVIAVGGPGAGATLLAFALGAEANSSAGVAGAASALAAAAASGPLDVERACGQCHSFDLVALQRHTRAKWESVIETMIGKGARISNDDFDVIADYLAAHYGAEAR